MSRPAAKGRQGTRHRLAYNNDRGFLDRLEPSAGVEAIVHEVVGRLRSTRIDTLIARVDRGNLVPFYDSAIEGVLGKGVTVFPTTEAWRSVTIMRRLLDGGIDPWAAVFQAARAAGMAAFAGIRMNDLHHTKQKPEYQAWSDLFISDLAKDSRYFIGPDCAHFPMYWREGPSSALSFLCPEVREHRYRIVEELVARYDVDGIELDFLRHGLFFPQSAVGEGAPLMTALLGRVRDHLDGLERRRGHPICLMVRVPSSLEACRQAGLNLPSWVRDGLVDIVAPYAMWEVEFDAPVEQFVELARGTHCEILTGWDTAMQPPYRRYTPDMARASAASYYRAGVDGIYFFNCHMFLAPYVDASGGRLTLHTPQDHRALYSQLHDPEAFRFRSKRYVVSRPFGRERLTYPKQLPLHLSRVQAGAAPHSVRISFADDLAAAHRLGLLDGVELRLRLRGLCQEDTIAVSLNGHSLDAASHVLPGDANSIGGGVLLAYAPNPDWLRCGVNTVAVSLTSATQAIASDVQLVDVEIAVAYRNVPTPQ